MDISIRTKHSVANADQRWIGAGGTPLGPNRSCILRRSTLASFEALGYVPSGIALRAQPDGRLCPYGGGGGATGGTNEAQTVTITGAPTGGSFTLTWSGQTTAAIAWNATAAAVQAALEALTNIAVGDVAVTGGPGPATLWTVTFRGALGGTDVAAMTATASLTGGSTPAVAIATTVAGVPDSDEVGLGYLFAAVPLDRLSTADVAGALFWNGEVITNYLPALDTTDAAFRADVANFISYVTHRV